MSFLYLSSPLTVQIYESTTGHVLVEDGDEIK